MKFEDAEPELRVEDTARKWKGKVQSVVGSRSNNKIKVRALKVQWENGQTEDFYDELPKDMKFVPWI